jgi:hypothetical protein
MLRLLEVSATRVVSLRSLRSDECAKIGKWDINYDDGIVLLSFLAGVYMGI